MKNWKYEKKENLYDEIPVGVHRVKINDVESLQSKSGNDMLKVTLDVSGYTSKLFYYIVFLENNENFTNYVLTKFYESFGIEYGNLDIEKWIGKTGAADCIYDNDWDNTKVHRFIHKDEQDDLPAWVGASNPAPMVEIEDEDLPF